MFNPSKINSKLNLLISKTLFCNFATRGKRGIPRIKSFPSVRPVQPPGEYIINFIPPDISLERQLRIVGQQDMVDECLDKLEGVDLKAVLLFKNKDLRKHDIKIKHRKLILKMNTQLQKGVMTFPHIAKFNTSVNSDHLKPKRVQDKNRRLRRYRKSSVKMLWEVKDKNESTNNESIL